MLRLAQFGLTPKSKRGLAASDPGEAVDVAEELVAVKGGRSGGTRWDRQFESCPERPPLPKSPVNLEGGINQRVREFWSVWKGHRTEKSHFGKAPRVSFRTRDSWETITEQRQSS